MTGGEKPKRKALHRGLDDIVNRDASLTSKLLGRVKPPSREPLEAQPADEESPAPGPSSDSGVASRFASEGAPSPMRPRPRAQGEPAEVRRIDEARTEARTPAVVAPEADAVGKGATVPKPAPMTFDEF